MRLIIVTAKTRAHAEGVKKIDDTHFEVAVTSPPHEGRANKSIIKAIAEYLDIAPSCITIATGHKGKRKLLRIV